jgi:CubicO group peptidase (beta-lactamase class C family)
MRIIIAAFAWTLLALLPTISAQVPSPPQQPIAPKTGATIPEQIPGPTTHALTKEDAEAWLDGFFPFALQRSDVAGAVVAVVKDGNILLQKGYGFADVAERKPVDPERTLFRAGSVSKLFGWTAVMQLVEQGKLDLDADINTYLDFKVPPRDGKPISLRHLMTHTSGFDETVRGLIMSNPKDLQSLGETVKRWVPPRVTDAGSTPAYSNYGATLAAYIVERVSGEAFDDYVERHIFTPLEMTHSSFRQPLPEALQPLMSKGYKVASGEAKPFEIISVAPAGSLSSSGGDMARFMIAHLQKGAFGSGRILQEATAVKMHGTPSAAAIPPLHRMLLGFYENDVNGHRVITHAGDTQWFHSELSLFPDDGVGLYVSVNSGGKEGAGGAIRAMFLRQFGDRYFPGPKPEGDLDAKTAKEHAQLMVGRYQLSRRPHSTFLSLASLLSQVKVAANDNGTITVDALKGPEGESKKWREFAPFVWRTAGSGERLAAKVENGRVVRFGYDEYPFMIFEPVPWWTSAGWLMPLWIGALLALALTVLAWPVSALVRRRYGVAYGLTGAEATMHRRIRITSLIVLALMIAWLVTVGKMLTDFTWVTPGMDGWVRILRLLSVVVFFAGAAIALWNARAVLRSPRKRLAKLWSVLLAIAFLTVLYVSIVFHFLGYSADY